MRMRLPSLVRRSVSALKLALRRRTLLPDGRPKPQVLVVGVYLADRANVIEHLVAEFSSAETCVVDQRWIALRGEPPSPAVAAVTVLRNAQRMAKFTYLNYLCMTTAWRHYDYVIVADDDIVLPDQFLDRFLSLQRTFDFALAQPARTHSSYIDHPITEVVDGNLARHTRFVEIGPLVSIRRDFARLIIPFDEQAPMGWGLDFVWPCVAQDHGLKIGIIDATPVDHSMRAPARTYDADSTLRRMKAYLSRRPHLDPEQAAIVLEAYPAACERTAAATVREAA